MGYHPHTRPKSQKSLTTPCFTYTVGKISAKNSEQIQKYDQQRHILAKYDQKRAKMKICIKAVFHTNLSKKEQESKDMPKRGVFWPNFYNFSQI